MPRYDGALATQNFDLIQQFGQALVPTKKWESIVDFAEHRSFCGMRLYPKQKTLLKLIYLETEHMTAYDIDVIESWRESFTGPVPQGVQPDIWQRVAYLKANGYDHFPHVQAVQGRRASKGVIGGVCGTERMAYLVSLDDPREYFGVRSDAIYTQVVATNSIQSKRFQFADIRQTVENCTYLKPYISSAKDHHLTLHTPADIRAIARLKMSGRPAQREMASVQAVALSSTSSSGRGSAAIANFFDEMAHMITGTGGARSSEEVYEAYQPSLDQFGKSALTYIPSSPFTKVGKFYDLYTVGRIPFVDNPTEVERDDDEELTASDPEMLIVQLPSWALYEDWRKSPSLGGVKFKRAIQVDPDGTEELSPRMKRQEKRNPGKFKVERRAQFAEVEDAYLDGAKIDKMFQPFWGGRVLGPITQGKSMFIYHGHGDPARTNCNFGFAIGHLEDAPGPDEHGELWPHVIIDYLKVWKPADYPDHTIDYVAIRREISELLGGFISMEKFTFDSWNSASMIADLKIAFPHIRILEADWGESDNQERAEKFKSALNLEWVHSYKDDFFQDNAGMGGVNQSLLELELKFLQEKKGKVIKQEFGPVTTKDLADCVMEVTTRLLSDALDKHAKMLASKVVGATSVENQGGLRSRTLGQQAALMHQRDANQQNNARNTLNGFGVNRGGPTPNGLDRLRGRRNK